MIQTMIVHTGEALIDFIPVVDADDNAAYRPSPGGSPYNSAIAVARLDVPVAFLGKLSRDFFGDQLLARLAENGVGTDWIARTDAPSTLAFVKKTEAGEARYAFFADGAADRSLTATDVPSLKPEVQAIVFGSISLIADPVSATILDLVERESAHRVVSFDPNIRTVLVRDEDDYRRRVARGIAASTIVKVSDEDLAWIVGTADLESAARTLLTQGPRMVVVTAGGDGAFAVWGDSIARVPAVPTSVSDTIGAGDSFHAALLSWLHTNGLLDRETVGTLDARRVEAMLRCAATVAAHTCSRPGADPPTRSELDPGLFSDPV
tara:strand:- start:27 stop:989 length:963 start_codon:yes stop_codon:yes gene_type:complete